MRESESSDILESPETASMQGMITQNHQVDVNQETWSLIEWFSSEISLYCCTMGLTENICVAQKGWVGTLLPNNLHRILRKCNITATYFRRTLEKYKKKQLKRTLVGEIEEY